MSSGMSEGLAFPSGFRGRSRNAVFPCLEPEDDAESGAPVVRLVLPAGYPLDDPPFPLPGRARWEICRQDRHVGSPLAGDAEKFSFVVWDASAGYQSWLQGLMEGADGDSGVTVILHETHDRVPRMLDGRPVLRLDCYGAVHQKLFALIGVLVIPSVFQSIVGADPADFRHLLRFGGELQLVHACGDEVETIAARFAEFKKRAHVPPPKLTGICLATVVPMAVPVVESIDALSRASQYQDTIADDVDVVLTAFVHRESGFSLTMLWIAGDDHSLEGA